jgi:hypothetical protein
MPSDSAKLMTLCQLALGLTQKEMGDLLGKNRRTIQRWQARGGDLMPDEAETLAKALRPERPDLADQVLALGQATATTLGIPPVATPEAIDAILQAAAEAAEGVSAQAIRAAVTAAFVKAAQGGFHVKGVAAGLEAGIGTG